MFELDSEFILINYFLKHPEDEISHRGLNELQNRIRENFGKSLYVDITDDSTTSAVKRNPHLFRWSDKDVNNIARAENSDEYYKSNINYLNHKIQPNLLEALLKACEQSVCVF